LKTENKKPKKLSSYTVFSRLILKMDAFKKLVPVKLGEGEDAVAGFRMKVIGAMWVMVPESLRKQLEPGDRELADIKMPKEYKLPKEFLAFYVENYEDLESEVDEEDPKKQSKAVSAHIVAMFQNGGTNKKSKSKSKAKQVEESDDEDSDDEDEAEAPPPKKGKNKAPAKQKAPEPEDSDSDSDSDDDE
jgi:hypothetical protein